MTPEDVVAVKMLSVEIPSRVVAWLLDNGRQEIEGLLRRIGPPDLSICDSRADLTDAGAAWELWALIRMRRWKRYGMGRTKTSKLLAAKRPALIPIYDQHVAKALFDGPDSNDWELWQRILCGSAGTDLREAVADMQRPP